MARKKRKRYGLRTRGGSSLRRRHARIVGAMRAPHRCPSCASPSVSRESVGVWSCHKCGYKFAGGAYMPSTKLGQASRRIRAPV
jgi:large subunit ribosomal protein L37Ae